MNETKVLPARLELRKPSGGKVRVLYLEHGGRSMRVLADRKLHPGMVLTIPKTQLSFRVLKQDGKEWLLELLFPAARLRKTLDKFGTAPIPPYIKKSPLRGKRLREEYQTVFARVPGSVAAPTASLHFTKRLLRELKKHGVKTTFVTLNVGLGTFAPLTSKQLRNRALHKEHYSISKASLEKIHAAKKAGRPVIAVGTTVARTLESFGITGALAGDTKLFIRPGHRFRMVDGLITNFHVPRSSLMMLVAAIVGRTKLMELYELAIKKRYRFFSFGDAMLIR
jgi:S-adenosylmethionine:tRNA ribosyltransferase-isomerase